MRSSIVLATLFAALGAAPAVAQSVPTEMNFTGRLTDAAGTPINGNRDLVIRLYDASAGGNELWNETFAATPFTQGMVYLSLGETTPLTATVFDGGPVFIEFTINGSVMSPRMPIGSVPYAIRADVAGAAETLGGLTASQVVTTVTAGAGLEGGGSGNNVTLGLMSCPSGQLLTSTGAGWACAAPSAADITGVLAGPGLVGGGTTGDVTVGANFTTAGGDSGGATTVARGDHLHDTRYYPQTTLNTAGTINAGGNPVDWTKLKGVPAGIADGIDGDTTYTAGAGLTLFGTQFSAAFTASGGSNGTATTVARGDHNHDPVYVARAGAYQNGLAAITNYDVEGGRYTIDAPPSTVGRVVAVNQTRLEALCRDIDGCDVTLMMINWDAGQPGNIASRSGHFQLSAAAGGWWRFDDGVGAPAGRDGTGLEGFQFNDCLFTDAETFTGTANGRADATAGWSLLNIAGGSYSDATVTCRIVIRD